MGEKAVMGYSGLSVVSIRHPEEARRVQERDGLVLWVDADPYERYLRISESQRGRIDDDKTFHEFLQEEEHDMNPGDNADPASVNMGAVRDIADLTIVNNHKTQNEYVEHLIKRFQLS